MKRRFRHHASWIALLVIAATLAALAGVSATTRTPRTQVELRAADAPQLSTGTSPRVPSTQQPATSAPPAGKGHGRIINGKPLDQTSFNQRWPFLVHYGDGTYACGGVLVTRRLVVTAAHCVSRPTDPTYIASIRILAGTVAANATTPKPVGVKKVTIHPSWTGLDSLGKSFDVAVLELSADAPAPSAPISVVGPGEDNIWGAGNGVDSSADHGPRIAGWGRTNVGDANGPAVIPNLAQETDFPIYSDRDCRRDSLGLSGLDTTNVVCGGRTDILATPTTTNGSGGCKGDSGGPLVANANGSWRLIGVLSTVDQYCNINRFGTAYTRLANVRDWLASLGVPIGATTVTQTWPTPPPRTPAAGAVIGGGPHGSGAVLDSPADGLRIGGMTGTNTFTWRVPAGVTGDRFRILSGTTVIYDGPARSGYVISNSWLPAGTLSWCVSTIDQADSTPGDAICRTVTRAPVHTGVVTSAKNFGRRWAIKAQVISSSTAPIKVTVRITRNGRTVMTGSKTLRVKPHGAVTNLQIASKGVSVGRLRGGKYAAVISIAGGGAKSSRTVRLR